MPSREFAKKNGQMSDQLAIDATRFRETMRATAHRVRGATARRATRKGLLRCEIAGDDVDLERRGRTANGRETACDERTTALARSGRRDAGPWGGVEKKTLADGRRGSRTAASVKRRGYFLCRARFNSFRCLCFRIFLRRFLITLPTGYLRAPRLQRRSVRMESFRRPERSRQSE